MVCHVHFMAHTMQYGILSFQFWLQSQKLLDDFEREIICTQQNVSHEHTLLLTDSIH